MTRAEVRAKNRAKNWAKFSVHFRASFAVQNDPQIFSQNASQSITPCLVAEILKFHLRELLGFGGHKIFSANRFSLQIKNYIFANRPFKNWDYQQRGLDANHANFNANRREDAIGANLAKYFKNSFIFFCESIRANLRNVGVRIAGLLSSKLLKWDPLRRAYGWETPRFGKPPG